MVINEHDKSSIPDDGGCKTSVESASLKDNVTDNNVSSSMTRARKRRFGESTKNHQKACNGCHQMMTQLKACRAVIEKLIIMGDKRILERRELELARYCEAHHIDIVTTVIASECEHELDD